jgi:hypothetical protein
MGGPEGILKLSEKDPSRVPVESLGVLTETAPFPKAGTCPFKIKRKYRNMGF